MYMGMHVLTCTHVYMCVYSCAHVSLSCVYSCAHVSLSCVYSLHMCPCHVCTRVYMCPSCVYSCAHVSLSCVYSCAHVSLSCMYSCAHVSLSCVYSLHTCPCHVCTRVHMCPCHVCTRVHMCPCQGEHSRSCAHISLPLPSLTQAGGGISHVVPAKYPDLTHESLLPLFTLTFPHHGQPMPEYFSIASSPSSPSPAPQPACSSHSTHPPHSGNQNDFSQSQVLPHPHAT